MFNLNEADGWIGSTAVFIREDGFWLVSMRGKKQFVRMKGDEGK